MSASDEPLNVLDFGAKADAAIYVQRFLLTAPDGPAATFQFSRVGDPTRWTGPPRRSKGWRRHVRRLKAKRL